MSKNKQFLLVIILIIVGIILGWYGRGYFLKLNLLQTTLPEEQITEEIGNNLQQKIILETPQAEEQIESPLLVRGQARGNWFFEGSFPVILTNWDGLIIAQGVAQAEGEWMTEDFVPFVATLEFVADTRVSKRGALILKKDNPSGLAEHDEALEITVFFK